MDAATFRTNFPEFTDATAYPDTLVTFWLGIAANFVSLDRWGTMVDLGTALFVAHNLVLQRQASLTVSKGGSPGTSSGVTSSKSVADVSVSYDTAIASVEGGGNYNLTTYGTRYLEYANMFGAGGLQF